VPRLYQVRANDLSNITFAEGDTGVVVIDACLSAETAKAGLHIALLPWSAASSITRWVMNRDGVASCQ
jgi:alkyl sulfatase BDS1-like metallo-beta-lactamase superfamily hydrolase